MMTRGRRSALFFGVMLVWPQVGSLSAADVKWAGTGRYRLLVEVPPTQIGNRERDEMVARCELSFRKLIGKLPPYRSVDL